MLCLEPSEQSVLNSSLVTRPSKLVMEERSEWKPVIHPVISYTLDSRLMEGDTYRERSAPGVYLDSGFMEGASCLEPLEQLVLVSSLAARPVEGITKKVTDWEPVINPVQDSTPDGQPMEETTYLEHSALGVSLDSGLMDVAYGTIGAISARSMGGRATGGDRHARASGSGITDMPQTGMFYIVGAADIGSCYSY